MPLVSLFFLVISLFGNTLFPPEGKIIYGGDLLTQFYFWKGYLSESIKGGSIPFWNPYNFSGTPFLSHPSTAFFYPGNIFFLIFPLNLSFSLFYAFHLLIAGFGMYKLVRFYASKLSSFASSTAFILSGFFGARIYAGHVDIISTVVWIPWVIWSTKNLLDRTSKINILCMVIFLSLEILAGYSAVVLFTVEFISLYLIYNFLSRLIQKKSISLKSYVCIIFCLITAISVTAIQWLPTLQFVNLSIRGKGLPYDMASWGSFPVSALKLFVNPYIREELVKFPYSFGGYILPNFFDYYMGRVILFSVIIFVFIRLLFVILNHVMPNNVILNLFQDPNGIPKQVRNDSKLSVQDDTKTNPDFWFYLFMVLFFVWLSFGNQVILSLHHLFYLLIPFYRNIRIPSQHLIMVVIILPVIFGLVINSVKYRLLQLGVVFLMFIELFSFSRQFYLLTDIPETKYDKKLIGILQDVKNDTRLLPDFTVVSPVLNSLDFNASLKYKIFSTSGYDPMILASYYSFIDMLNKSSLSSQPYFNVEIPPLNPNVPNVDFLNIEYLLVEPMFDPIKKKEFDKYEEIIKNANFSLYRNKKTFNRFFFVPLLAVILPDEREVKGKLLEAKSDVLKNSIFISRKESLKLPQDFNYNCDSQINSKVTIVKYSNSQIILETEVNCNGFLSSSEVYYPGWKATIDGRETPILKSNYSFRSLYLSSGKHLVRFYYSPDIYFLGGLISIFSGSVFILFLNFYKLKPVEYRKD